VIATQLPLPTLREQRLRAALHERGWADVGLLLVTDLDVSTLGGTRPQRPTCGDRSTRSGLRRWAAPLWTLTANPQAVTQAVQLPDLPPSPPVQGDHQIPGDRVATDSGRRDPIGCV
jgi:hypothetical protein